MKKPANQSVAIDISAKCCSDDEVILWVKALEALKSVKLDEVATKTTFESCKYCKFPKTTKTLDSDELDEIVKLNEWKPVSIKKQNDDKLNEQRKKDAEKYKQLREMQKQKELEEELKRKFKNIEKRDNYNFPARALSLLGVNVEEFMKKPRSEQMRIIMQKQEEFGKPEEEEEPDKTGDCCVKKLQLFISNLTKGNFTPEEKTEKIQNLLSLLEKKRCFKLNDPTHCNCLLNKIDIPKLKETAKLSVFIKRLIMESFNKALNEKIASKFGLASTQFQDDFTQISLTSIEKKPEICCPDETCLCLH